MKNIIEESIAVATIIPIIGIGLYFLSAVPITLYEEYMTTKNSNAVANCTPEPRYWDSPNTYTMNCEIIIK